MHTINRLQRLVLTALTAGMLMPLVSSAADAEAGKAKAQACTACHGANGISVSDDIPNLAGQKVAYITAQLNAFREGTRKNALMNAMAAQLSETDVENVATFFNSLASVGESEMSEVGAALGESKIEFPADYKETFELYSKIDKAAKKQVRHNLVNAHGLAGLDGDGRLADGAFVLTEIYAAKVDGDGNPVKGDDGHFVADKLLVVAAMEKRKGWGDAIPEELRNEDWNYALFEPDGSPKATNQAKCLACHKPLHDADYLFSYESFNK